MRAHIAGGRVSAGVTLASSARVLLVLVAGLTTWSRCSVADDGNSANRTSGVRGRILLDGPVPKPGVLVPKGGVGSDGRVYRDARYLSTAVYDESLSVGRDGGIANVLVYLKQAPRNSRMPAVASEPVIIEQIDGRLRPHVMVVRTGQTVIFHNREEFACNLNPRYSATRRQGCCSRPVMSLSGSSIVSLSRFRFRSAVTFIPGCVPIG